MKFITYFEHRTKTYCKPNLNDRWRPTTMSGHEPEKAGHCLCLLLICLDNLLLQSGATYCVLLFLAAGCARARAPALWSWRRREAGGRGGAGDLLRLFLQQYVEERFEARPERSRRCPSSAPATVRPRELRSARRPWFKWCRQKEGTGGQ